MLITGLAGKVRRRKNGLISSFSRRFGAVGFFYCAFVM